MILRESRGLYRLADAELGSNIDLIQVALRISKGVICLISALSFHELTTQIPHQVYVALPIDAEKPRLEYPPLRLFWLSQKAYSAGMESHELDGIPVKIYGIEGTEIRSDINLLKEGFIALIKTLDEENREVVNDVFVKYLAKFNGIYVKYI